MIFKLMSNRLFKKLPPERYVVLATIPQDMMFWGDAECFAFDNAVCEFKHMHWQNDFDFYETYEGIYDLNENFKHNPREEVKTFDGVRHLIALKKSNELLDACKQALEDLEIWHGERGAYRGNDGGIYYSPCGGCDTCEITMPELRAAIAKAEANG
jgi:hypothetical protein